MIFQDFLIFNEKVEKINNKEEFPQCCVKLSDNDAMQVLSLLGAVLMQLNRVFETI